MSEIASRLTRASNMLSERIYSGVETCINHAIRLAYESDKQIKQLKSLNDAQTKSMTEMHLKIKELTERQDYLERRARAAEVDDQLESLRAYGLNDQLHGSDQDA